MRSLKLPGRTAYPRMSACASVKSGILREPPRGQTLISPVMFADAHEDDIVVDPCDLSFRPAPWIDASLASIQRPSVDGGRPFQPSSVGARLGQNHLQDGTEARKSSDRDPPRHQPLTARLAVFVPALFRGAATVPSRPTTVRNQLARVLGRLQF